jgi:sacsin
VGRLFSTLPLPILTGLPVHIHGIFSISADRSRLHGLDDGGAQDHRPKEWNKFLFDQIIPRAWAKLLWNICQTYPTENHFHSWPTNGSDTRLLWHSVCGAVVDQISQSHMPLWFTHIGHVALEDGLLAAEETELKEKAAFREAKLPVIFVVNHLFDEARRRSGSRSLQPRTLYEYLRHMENFNNITRQSRLVLLEILLREIPLTDLGALEIFPFEDGNFRSLRLPPVFLHRNSFEKTLFARQLDTSINADLLSNSASGLLHEGIKKNDQMVRYRTPEDLRDYFLNHIANGLRDTISIDEERISVLKQVWIWILRYSKYQLPLSALGPLWLIPLRGSAARKLVPLDTSNFVTWFRPGEVNDLALKISASNPKSNLKILAGDVLNEEILQFLLSSADHEPSLRIKDGTTFENFLEFLAQDRSLMRTAAEDVKDTVLRVLKQLYWSKNQTNRESVCKNFKSLCLFKAIRWPENAMDSSVTRCWTDMTNDIVFVGLASLVPVPSTPKRVFLDVTNETERALFEKMGLLKCINDVQILEEIVIPELRDGGYDKMNPSLRLDAATLLFQNYYHISPSARNCLSGLAVVPIEKRKNDNSLNFARPSDILNPQKPALINLYFEDEICLPEREFYDRFAAILAECGMVQCLNERVVLDRVRSYGRRELGFSLVASRATKLLQMPFQEDSAQLVDLIQVVRGKKWLPARAPDKSDCLTNSSECRDTIEEPFVGHVWHVLPFQIEESWRSVLGWHDCIDVDVLISQLVRSIAARDVHSIDQTLSYLYRNHPVEKYADRLSELSFVLTTDGELANAATVCHRGVEKLIPYLHGVESRFWDHHSEIMNLTNVPELPRLEQLKNVQKDLESKDSLKEQDLDVATELARIWGNQFPETTDGLKLPNDNGAFLDVRDFVFNDTPWLSAGTRAILHPKISRTIAEQLKIEPLSELLRKGELGIADTDDDEFYQREEIADGIRDTLDRYTREHTFHEYLANADDCGSASEVNFFFDGTSYGTKCLLTEDLKSVQGPSLLIHNNGGE